MPSTEPITPIVSASSSTELSTWRRVAPSVRSSASSRERCATVIENVLKIRNAPTSTAMNANASRPVVRNESPSRMSSPSSSASCAAVRTCAVGGSSEATLRCSSVCETPSRPATNAKSTLPRLSNSVCAVGRSKTTKVAPPSPADWPMVARPTSLNARFGAAGGDRHLVAELEVLLVGGRRRRARSRPSPFGGRPSGEADRRRTASACRSRRSSARRRSRRPCRPCRRPRRRR